MPTQYEIVEFGFADDSVVYAIKFKSPGIFSNWEYAKDHRGRIIQFTSLEEAEREAENLLD
jgi:hypothetical protein